MTHMPPSLPSSILVKIARNGVEIGEYKAELIPALLEAGVLKKTDHYWAQGMAGWISLGQFLPAAPSMPKAATKPAGATWWLVGGFFMPYFFAWRIIFDKAYGFSTRTKVMYSLWLACFFLPFIMPSPAYTDTSSTRSETQESKNAAFMARLTPEQRIAVETLQRNARLALRENFDYQDSNRDGRLDMREFLSQGLLKHSYVESDFDRKDTDKDGSLSFEEYIK